MGVFPDQLQTCLVQVPQKTIVQDRIKVLHFGAMEGHHLTMLSG